MTPADLPQSWAAYLGSYAATAIITAAAVLWFVRMSSEKWLTAKFAERLAALKHLQEKELERVKFEINATFDRRIKLHQREFDVLPEAWGKISDAYSLVRTVSLGFQSIPDVNRLTGPQIEELLATSRFAEWQKDELRLTKDKTSYYSRAKSFEDARTASAAYDEFTKYFSRNGIFIQDQLKDSLKAIQNLLLDALLEIQHGGRTNYEAGMRLHKQGSELLSDLEKQVKTRLWSDTLA